jgi:predicted deacylase
MGTKWKILSIPRSNAAVVDIPYFECEGDKPGPHLTVLAGVHGAEYSSIAAARKFILELGNLEISGKITVVPIVNILAFWQRSPFVIPVDNQNLNRAFPGKADGSFTEQYAYRVFEEFIRPTDFLLDMHAGDIPESLEPFSIFEESPVEVQSLAMADSYGIKNIVRQRQASLVVAGSTSATASAVGIPAIIAESGENGILDPVAVERHLIGVRNLATTLKILPGQAFVMSERILYQGWNWLRAEKAGWWEPAQKTGAMIKVGDLLGTLSDVWGESFELIRAEQDGNVLFQTSSPAVIRDGILVGLALS